MIAIVLYAYTSWKYHYHIQVKCLIETMLSKDNATLHKKDALPPTWSNVTWNEKWDICYNCMLQLQLGKLISMYASTRSLCAGGVLCLNKPGTAHTWNITSSLCSAYTLKIIQ